MDQNQKEFTVLAGIRICEFCGQPFSTSENGASQHICAECLADMESDRDSVSIYYELDQ